jgi:hypothetical protein
MQKKYCVEYSLQFRKHSPPAHHTYFTDDAVEVETFVAELLARGMGLHAIRRDGGDLPSAEFDRIVRIAASEVASKLICATLAIKPDEERFRFGFAA